MAKILTVFLSTIPYVKTIRGDGKEIAFRDGKYVTDDAGDIAFLTAEISAGHPHLKIPSDVQDRTISSDLLDPMAALEARIREKILREMEQAQANNPANDRGTTEQEPLKPASSADVSEAMTGQASNPSPGVDALKAKLAGLKGGSESNGAALVNLPSAQ